jgi:pectinesterase
MEIKELYVDAKGGSDYVDISEALEAAKAFADMKVIIHIAAGVYKERLVIQQNNLSFIGEDKSTTKITYSDAAHDILPNGEKRGTFRTSSVFIDCDNFYARNISFYNEAGQGQEVGQAIAVYADGDRLVFEDCIFDGYQDTLFTAPLPLKEIQKGGFKGPKEFAPRRLGRHLYKNCYIAGNVDFIFGGAIAYFEGCELFLRNRNEDINGYVTAPSTFEGQKYGYVFNHCHFTSNCPPSSAYLGRPWRNYAKAVVINSEIDGHIKKEGWHDWNKTEARDTMYFAEYGNYGEGASNERAPFVKMLTKEEADEYTIENVLGFVGDEDSER